MVFKNSVYNACLFLSSGEAFYGFACGSARKTTGEICFTTSSLGYQHTITDPSFTNQIIVFTSPHIGNVGINSLDNESIRPLCSGIVIREKIVECNHFLNNFKFDDWLKENNIAGICGLDTRAVVQTLRTKGAQNAVILFGNNINYESGLKAAKTATDIEPDEFIKKVSYRNEKFYCSQAETKKKVVVIDFGVKKGIINYLSQYFNIEVIKATVGFTDEIKKHAPDGVVLSNGPGDPSSTFEYLKADLEKITSFEIPILGICFGHQLLAITFGCKTKKMAVGHRGANHPVINLTTNKVEITSQNHGFVVDENTLANNIEVTHRSLFDGSIEGIAIKNRKIFSVQYHPEGSPGPNDSKYIFAKFADEVNGK